MDSSSDLASYDTLLFLSGSLPSSSSFSFVAFTSAVFSSGAAATAEDSEVGEAEAEGGRAFDGVIPLQRGRFWLRGRWGRLGTLLVLVPVRHCSDFFTLVVVDVVVVVAEGAGLEGGFGLADLLPASGTELLRLSMLFPFVDADTIALAPVCANPTVGGDVVRCCC